MTKQGLKAIEEIKVGDQVLSYNDNLEIFEYKDVVELYNNETTELCRIYTETEEIVCTPNHSVLTIDGWKEAKELTNKDLVKTSNGYVKVLSIKLEQLQDSQKVYNFNVLGYHTYVIGNDLLVVHNGCKNKDIDFDSMDDAIKYADDALGPNSTIVNKQGKDFHTSADGNWTWRKDYHGTTKRSPQDHINLEKWKFPFGTKNNKKLANIHLWYKK